MTKRRLLISQSATNPGMDDLSSCAPEGQPFATKEDGRGHQPHELPWRHMIPRQKRDERQND